MFKQIIFILVLCLLIGIGLHAAAAAPDIGIVQSVVVKPPDVATPSSFTPPSVVSPIAPISHSPVKTPSVEIVRSPVMGTGNEETY